MDRGPKSARGPAAGYGAARGGETVLDAMLEAALAVNAGDADALTGRPPRTGRARGATQSASPRPQRVRPVDAVRLAKTELAQMEGKGGAAFSKVRMRPQLDSGEMEKSGMHDGFYDFAAAVVRPQPSARQYALQLRAQLDDSLRDAQTLPITDDSRERNMRSGAVIAARRSKKEVEVCVETLERFVLDTTIDSKERESLLNHALQKSKEASEKMLSLLKACCTDLDDAAEHNSGLESSLQGLDDDNNGLRRVVQQMLGTETELRTQASELQSEVARLKEQMEEKDQIIIDGTAQLERTAAQLQDLKDEQARGRPTTDQCVSPMMGFAAFVMSPDQVPSGDGSTVDSLPSYPGGIGGNIGGGQKGEGSASGSSNNPRRKTVSDSQKLGAGGGRNAHPRLSHSRVSMSMPMDVSLELQAHHRASSTSHHFMSKKDTISSLNSMARSAMNSPDPYAGDTRSISVVSFPISLQAAVADAAVAPVANISDSARSSHPSPDHQHNEFDLQPSLLATSFPALIPFVDFHMLDPDLSKSEADALTLNSEHLEKHLVMLQDDYQKEVSHTEELQQSVDTSLERLLVWVQAVHDSLQDVNSNAIQQDIRALVTLRNAVEWLAKHPCKEWTSHLDEVLDRHEGELRGHLAVERPADSETEDLRKTLAVSRQRVQDLSDQLLEARASMGGPVRSKRQPESKRVSSMGLSSMASFSSEKGVQNVGTQCDLMAGTSAFITEAHVDVSSSSEPRQDNGLRTKSPRSGRTSLKGSSIIAEASVTVERGVEVVSSPSLQQRAPGASSSASASPLSVEDAVQPDALQADAADEAAGGASSSDARPTLAKGAAAAEMTTRESKRMLLLRCPFVEAIDFTAVPAGSRVLLNEPCEDRGSSKHDDKMMGSKQLRALIIDVYTQKKADDLRKDKLSQPRRPLHVLLQEVLRRSHGVKKVVHQKSWLLVESMMHHSATEKMVDMFTEFLDGSRDIEELSFYLHCSSVLATSVIEESGALPPTRFLEGYIGYSRAIAAAELFFGDLPKALAVTKMELEKVAVVDENAEQDARAALTQQVKEGVYHTSQTFTEGIATAALCVLSDNLYEILLEGWRMSALLLGQSIPSFSWRRCVLAFIQADICQRGWLDPHEVRQTETRRLQVQDDGLPTSDSTSLGAFVLRSVQRCTSIPGVSVPQAPTDAQGVGRPRGAADRRRLEKKKAEEVSLHVVSAAFESMKKSVEVYLTWLMHSEELRDLAIYRTVKSQIFSFQQASGNGDAASSAHHLRSLLLLLLAHQFDMQFQQESTRPEHLDWDLRCLLQLLRESWRRGADSEAGPEFGLELDAIGNAAALAEPSISSEG